MPTTPIPIGTEITVGDVILKILVDPFEGGIDERGRPWRTVAYLCPGSDVDTACDTLKGIGTSAFLRPHRYPNNENLLVQSVQFKLKGPRSKGTHLVTAPYAVIHCQYGTPEFDIYGEDTSQAFGGLSIPWASYQIRGGTETVPWPKPPNFVGGGTYRFADAVYNDAGIYPDAYSLTYYVATKQYIIRRSKVPNFQLFDDLLESLEGKVNASPLFNRPRGTMLLLPTDYDADFDGAGKRLGEFTMAWSYRAVEHNARPVPGKLGKFSVVEDADENNDYAYTDDFNLLFEFGL